MITKIFLNSTEFLENSSGEINNDWPSTVKVLGQSLLLILFISVVLFFTFYFIKMSNKYKSSKKTDNLELLDSIPIAYQTYLQIVKAGNKYILLSISKDKVSYLTEIDEIKINEDINDDSLQNKFESYFKKFMNNNNSDKNNKVG